MFPDYFASLWPNVCRFCMATKTSKLLFQVGNQSEKLWALKKYHGTTIHEFGLNACCAAFKFNSKLGNPTSRNPTIFNIMCWVAGSMGDHLINQVTDVPSIIFFIISCKIFCKKRVLSALSPSQQPIVFFSIYQNNTWTNRHLIN